MSSVEAQATEVERLAERATQQRAQVRTPANVATFSEEELQRREQRIGEEFEQAAGAVIGRIDAEIATAERTILQAERPLDAALTEAELRLANARLPYVQEDTKLLALDDLAIRCRVALDGGDRPEQFLLARFVGLRLEAEHERRQAAGRMLTQPEAARLEELRQHVIALNFRVDDQRANKAAAEAKLKEARKARIRAGRAHSEGSGAVERAMAAMRASGRYGRF